MSEVEVPYGDSATDTAVLLLAAAEELDLDPAVVKSQEGHFLVPEEVAEKAGVDYHGDEDEAAPEPPPEEPVEETKAPAKPAAKKTAAAKK
jgi:hypothetical protein